MKNDNGTEMREKFDPASGQTGVSGATSQMMVEVMPAATMESLGARYETLGGAISPSTLTDHATGGRRMATQAGIDMIERKLDLFQTLWNEAKSVIELGVMTMQTATDMGFLPNDLIRAGWRIDLAARVWCIPKPVVAETAPHSAPPPAIRAASGGGKATTRVDTARFNRVL